MNAREVARDKEDEGRIFQSAGEEEEIRQGEEGQIPPTAGTEDGENEADRAAEPKEEDIQVLVEAGLLQEKSLARWSSAHGDAWLSRKNPDEILMFALRRAWIGTTGV